ncbi:hypothetical protein AAVH_02499 [Aphelenchoides avenae]|nr:hypothetical protein AAVH_02499 [Aphelenchus avenae]
MKTGKKTIKPSMKDAKKVKNPLKQGVVDRFNGIRRQLRVWMDFAKFTFDNPDLTSHDRMQIFIDGLPAVQLPFNPRYVPLK